MASKYYFNLAVTEAQDRIYTAVEALSERLHLSSEVRDNLKRTHRDPEVRQRYLLEGVADVLESVLSGFDAHVETIGANADLPADLPARNALLAAGHTSAATVRSLPVDELRTIKGIGETRARAILDALNPKVVPPAKVVESAKVYDLPPRQDGTNKPVAYAEPVEAK